MNHLANPSPQTYIPKRISSGGGGGPAGSSSVEDSESVAPAARLVQEIEAKAQPNTFTGAQRRSLLDGVRGLLAIRPLEIALIAVEEVFSAPNPPRTPGFILERIGERLAALESTGDSGRKARDPNAGLKESLHRLGVPPHILHGNRERILENAQNYLENYARDFTDEDNRRRLELSRFIEKEWYSPPQTPETERRKENA
ncbi:MAG: hypothetical protein ACOYXN_13610 [Acidobacteriota bacterium]